MAASPGKGRNDPASGDSPTTPIENIPNPLEHSTSFPLRTPDTIVELPEDEQSNGTARTVRPSLPRSGMSTMASGINRFRRRRTGSTNNGRSFVSGRPAHSAYFRRPHHAQLAWAEDAYYEQNPWYDEANTKKPIFSLGKPLPHKTRWKAKEVRVPVRDEEQGGQGPAFREVLAAVPVSEQGDRLSTVSSAAAQNIHGQQSRTTGNGVAHSHKRNDAGQPVFNYVPDNDSEDPHSRDPVGRSHSNLEASVSGRPERPDGLNYKIDGEPMGQQERTEVEEGHKDPNEMRNWWARFRAKHPEVLAEFLATMVAVFLGISGTLSVNLSAKQTTKYGDYETSCWAWGFAWMFGIYLGGGVSGAHMNPAISISLSIFRGFPWGQCALYVISQFLGSIVAGALAYGIFADSIRHVDPDMSSMATSFFSSPQEWVSMSSAFGNQVVGGAVMTIAVFALGDDQNNPPGAGMHALVLGLLVTTLKFTLGYNIGSALNPASDFGPRVIAYAVGYRGHEVWQTHWWIYGPWIATIIGSILGCILYDGFVFVGSESPVNYRPSEGLKKRTKKLFKINNEK